MGCKFITNDPGSGNMHRATFCCEPVEKDGSPYCAEHANLCYVRDLETKRRHRRNGAGSPLRQWKGFAQRSAMVN